MLCLSVLTALNLCTDANFTVSVAKPGRKMAGYRQSPTDLYSSKWRLLHRCTPTQGNEVLQDVKGGNQRR